MNPKETKEEKRAEIEKLQSEIAERQGRIDELETIEMTALESLKSVLLDPSGVVSFRTSDKDVEIIHHSLAEIERQLKMSIEDLINQFVTDLDFDVLIVWADLLGVDHDEQQWLGDMWVEREVDLRTAVVEAMGKIGTVITGGIG